VLSGVEDLVCHGGIAAMGHGPGKKPAHCTD
jgi:hypothetical protein